jgi:hypothetical protein
VTRHQDVQCRDVFGTPDGQVVQVTRVGRTGRVTVQVVGGAQDGELRRVDSIPDDWSRYPSGAR